MRADSSAPMPASGSSSSSTLGSVASVMATSSWRRSPCDNADAMTSRRAPSSQASSARSAASFTRR